MSRSDHPNENARERSRGRDKTLALLVEAMTTLLLEGMTTPGLRTLPALGFFHRQKFFRQG